MIHIPPDKFWDMSVCEVSLCIEGFQEYNGQKSSGDISKDDLKDLFERYPDA